MVSVCLPSDALLQHLPSYLGFFYLGRGVSLHGCSSKAQPLLLTLDEGYLLMRNAGLEETQAGIKLGGRNINNLRYADDTVAEQAQEGLEELSHAEGQERRQ